MSASAVGRLAARASTLWSLGSRAVSMAASIVLTIVVAKHFAGIPDGLARTGTWGIAYVALFGVATLTRLGGETLALRLTASDPGLARPWARGALWTSVLLGIVGALGLAMAVHALEMVRMLPRGWLWAALFASSVIPVNLLSLAGAWLRGLGQVPLGSFVELGALPITALVGIGALRLVDNQGIGGIFCVFTVAAWATGLVSTAWALRCLTRAAPGVPARSLREYLGTHGRALSGYTLTALGLFFYAYLAVLFFGAIGREPDAALYRNALTLANFVGLLSTMQVSYLAPRFAALQHHGTPRAVNVLAWRSTLVATVFGLLVALPLLLVPAHLLAIVYHPDYVIAANILRVLTLAQLVSVAFGPVYPLLLMAEGLERTSGWITVGVLGATLLAMVLVQPLGPPYVAAASTLAPIGFAFVSHLVLWRSRGIRSALWQPPPRA